MRLGDTELAEGADAAIAIGALWVADKFWFLELFAIAIVCGDH